jgi:hypothetical protein
MADDDLAVSAAEYQAAMTRVALAAQCVADEPLDRMLATITRAHTLGPIVMPTDYRQALSSGSLDAQEAMLKAARAFAATLPDVITATTTAKD